MKIGDAFKGAKKGKNIEKIGKLFISKSLH